MKQSLALLLVTLLIAPVLAQGGGKKKPKDGKPKRPVTGKYVNKDLGISFAGVYGWELQRAEGSGAWTRLVRYYDEDYDAEAILYVRNNPYKTTTQLKAAIVAEFKEGGEPGADKVVFKNISINEADMKGSVALPGIEVEGIAVRVTEEGKKRERAIVVRTYFGKARLYRVFCTVRRTRLKNVRDLFTRAVSGVTVTEKGERVTRGIPFRSSRGLYSCTIPEGFVADLPGRKRSFDMEFASTDSKVRIYVYSFVYDGTIQDQTDDLIEFYGDEMKLTKEETKILGGEAMQATITRNKRVTLVTAVLKRNRIFRIHVSGPESMAKNLDALQADFIKGFRTGR